MGLDIREAGADEDAVLVAHYRALWDSYGTDPADYAADADAITQGFIDAARADGGMAVFHAHVDGALAGSAACNPLRPRYPEVLRPEKRLHGYIWSVWVDPAFRGRGIGEALVRACMAHLQGLGCTTVVLNASDAGVPLYSRLGFAMATEMRHEFPSRA